MTERERELEAQLRTAREDFAERLIEALDLGDEVQIDQTGDGDIISVPDFIRGFALSEGANDALARQEAEPNRRKN